MKGTSCLYEGAVYLRAHVFVCVRVRVCVRARVRARVCVCVRAHVVKDRLVHNIPFVQRITVGTQR